MEIRSVEEASPKEGESAANLQPEAGKEAQRSERARAPGRKLGSSELRAILILGDLIVGALATFFALLIWSQPDWLDLSFEFIQARAPWFLVLPFVWNLLMLNLYDPRKASSRRETLRGVIFAGGAGVVLYLGIFFLSPAGSLPRRGVAYFLVLAIALTIIWRLGYIRVFTAPAFKRRALIIGAGESGRALVEVFGNMNPAPLSVIGLIDDDQDKHGLSIGGSQVLGDNAQLLDFIEGHEISDLIVSIVGPMSGEMLQSLLVAQEQGVEITRMPVLYEELLGRVPIHHLETDWVVRSFVDEVRVSGLYLLGKRLLDLAGALAGLLVLLLVFPWISLAILLESGRPILLKQRRLGQGGKEFEVLKFRTMHKDAEADGQAHWAREDDPRKTKVGSILRRIHLDEFPQFWNVLKGEMSLVGPRPERPELVEELEQQIPFYRARLLVKPGIGGWAQVNYGKGASVVGSAEKLEYDLYYIKHRSLLMDSWIILRSIGSAIVFRGV